MAKTRAQLNRAVRQDALREQLAEQGHLQHVVELLGEVKELSLSADEPDTHVVTKFEMDKRLAIVDRKLKLVNKYIPDLKQQDIQLGSDSDSPMLMVTAQMTPEEAHAAYIKAMEG